MARESKNAALLGRKVRLSLWKYFVLYLFWNELKAHLRRVETALIQKLYHDKKVYNNGKSYRAKSQNGNHFGKDFAENNLTQCRTVWSTAITKTDKETFQQKIQMFCNEPHWCCWKLLAFRCKVRGPTFYYFIKMKILSSKQVIKFFTTAMCNARVQVTKHRDEITNDLFYPIILI